MSACHDHGSVPGPPETGGSVLALIVGGVVDVERGQTLPRSVIVVEGGKITAITAITGDAPPAVPAQARVIDLAHAIVMPGLFDCHTHLCWSVRRAPTGTDRDLEGNALLYSLINNAGYRAIQGVANARSMLHTGFTTVRDVGNAGDWLDSDLRRAIEDGLVPGPTIVNSGKAISPFGGQYRSAVVHADWHGRGAGEYIFADTRDELKRAVRQNILHGAKLIKLIIDDQPYIYSEDDIRHVVEEAGAAGFKVATHCASEAGARNSAAARVASIEHGFHMTDETLALARDNGVFLVGTELTEAYLIKAGASEHVAKIVSDLLLDRLRRAHKVGVQMAFGSDIMAEIPGEDRGSLSLSLVDSLRAAPLPPALVLQMLTSNAARLLGVDRDRGALRPGLAADIIAVPTDPLLDLDALRHVHFVMKDGKVIRGPGPAPAA